jgi:co-chaperonin GroES (HSP10)
MHQQVSINSTEFQPKNEYILVKPESVNHGEKSTKSGIVFAMAAQATSTERPTSGYVIAKGSDIDDINDGDFILWPNTDGLDIEFDDGEFVLLRYKSVIGSKR